MFAFERQDGRDEMLVSLIRTKSADRTTKRAAESMGPFVQIRR